MCHVSSLSEEFCYSLPFRLNDNNYLFQDLLQGVFSNPDTNHHHSCSKHAIFSEIQVSFTLIIGNNTAHIIHLTGKTVLDLFSIWIRGYSAKNNTHLLI